jgi:ATP-binding cassette subfamily C protein LapB
MQALKLATRVIVMQQGEVVNDGKPESVMPQMLARAAIGKPTAPARRNVGGALDVV